MKSLDFIKGLPKQKSLSFGNYKSYIIDHASFPEYVIDELGLTNDSILTLETVMGGKVDPHVDSGPRKAHIIWMISNSPMTVVTTSGTTVLNYGDSMVVESKSQHSASVKDSKDAIFIGVDYGKSYTETQEIYLNISK